MTTIASVVIKETSTTFIVPENQYIPLQLRLIGFSFLFIVQIPQNTNLINNANAKTVPKSAIEVIIGMTILLGSSLFL